MSDLRIGIVGLHNHYHSIPFAQQLSKGIPGLRLVAVADERLELARRFADEYCGGDHTGDYAALIRRDDAEPSSSSTGPRTSKPATRPFPWPR